MVNLRGPLLLGLFCLLGVFGMKAWAANHANQGWVDAIHPKGDGSYLITGWACASNFPQSISVDLYLGGPAGQGGVFINRTTANLSSEPAIAQACQSTGKNYRFQIPIPTSVAQRYSKRAIFVHGINPFGLPNVAIGNSGSFTIPKFVESPSPTLVPTAIESFWLRLPESRSALVRSYGSSSTDPTWANADSGQFHGMYNGEFIMLDARGPGMIDRIHMTTSYQVDRQATRLKIYFDDEVSPRVNLSFEEFFSGKASPFLAPLVGDFNVSIGGFFSYVPIPFARRIIVTISRPEYFYNIGYHLDSSGAIDRSFSMNDPHAPLATLFQRAGLDPIATPLLQEEKVIKIDQLKKGATREVLNLVGPKEISTLRFSVSGIGHKDESTNPQLKALKETWLHIYWDDESVPSVSAPLSYIFGVGSSNGKVRSMAFGFDAGEGYLYLPMPFAHSSRLVLENRSTKALKNIKLKVKLRNHLADFSSGTEILPFHVTYQESITTRGNDVSFLETEGHGHVVGVVYNFNGISQLLEGDERVYIDGDASPAIQGTGTEDFFNVGWYWSRCLMQPDCTYPWHEELTLPTHGMVGQKTAYRLFVTDAVVFHSSIKFHIEHGPLNNDTLPEADWMKETLNIPVSSAMFWYGRK